MKLVQAITVLSLCLLPGLANAQTCALLPPGQPEEGPPAPPDLTANVTAAVTQALVGDGLTVISPEDAQRRMTGQPFAECNQLDCGANVVQSLGVDFAVLVTVWAPRGAPTSVVVTLITGADSSAGDAPVENNDVVAAALAALQTARQRFQTSQMGFLDVRSTPPGAEVEVDGRSIGQTPVRRLVPAGARAVVVRLTGHDTHEETVQVVATQEHAVEVTLEPAAEGIIDENPPPPATGGSYTEPHFANWLIGGALIAGGIAALISPFWTLATEGQCVDAEGLPMGWCRSEARFGPASGVLLGVGGAAIIGGAVFMIAQPITMTTSVSPDSAYVEVRGTF